MVNTNEPLVHGAENDRGFAAPAKGVAVMVIFLVQEGAAEAQFVQDGRVGVALAVFFQRGLADHLRRHLLFDGQIVGESEAAVVINGRINGQAVLASKLVVLQAVAGGDMDEAGAGVLIHKASPAKSVQCGRKKGCWYWRRPVRRPTRCERSGKFAIGISRRWPEARVIRSSIVLRRRAPGSSSKSN